LVIRRSGGVAVADFNRKRNEMTTRGASRTLDAIALFYAIVVSIFAADATRAVCIVSSRDLNQFRSGMIMRS
jgi:hypothetical protein